VYQLGVLLPSVRLRCTFEQKLRLSRFRFVQLCSLDLYNSSQSFIFSTLEFNPFQIHSLFAKIRKNSSRIANKIGITLSVFEPTCTPLQFGSYSE